MLLRMVLLVVYLCGALDQDPVLSPIDLTLAERVALLRLGVLTVVSGVLYTALLVMEA